MRTTLDLPEETWRKLKVEAAQRGYQIKELLAQLIERGLEASAAQSAAARPRSLLPIAIARDPSLPLSPALTNAELHAILAQQDLADYGRVAQASNPAA